MSCCGLDQPVGHGHEQGVGQARDSSRRSPGRAGGLRPWRLGCVAPGRMCHPRQLSTSALAQAGRHAESRRCPGTFSVPPRRPRSWAAPCKVRTGKVHASAAWISAPDALGPAQLVGRQGRRCGRRVSSQVDRRSCPPPGPRRRAASRWRRGPGLRSLGDGLDDAALVVGVMDGDHGAAGTGQGLSQPGQVDDAVRIDGMVSTGLPETAAASATQGCSVAPTINRSQPAAMALRIAWALDSVPPDEKTTAVGSAPTRSATWARAFSMRARARRPAACTATDCRCQRAPPP